MSNPFSAHDDNQKAYEAMMSEPVSPADGGGGGWIKYAGSDEIVATVGPFMVQDVLEGGGFVRKMMAQVIVRKAVLPEGMSFFSSNPITVKEIGGTVRACKIHTTQDVFTEWRLDVFALNQ